MNPQPMYLKNINTVLYQVTPNLRDFTFFKGQSSNVDLLAFNPATSQIFARFKSGGASYLYHEVPHETFINFDPKGSPGEFVAKYLRPLSKFEKIEDRRYDAFIPDYDRIVDWVYAVNMAAEQNFQIPSVKLPPGKHILDGKEVYVDDFMEPGTLGKFSDVKP